MAQRDMELRHIVDVDGQLIGIDADVVNAADLLRRAGCDSDRQLFLVRNRSQMTVAPHQRVRLREDEVMFFETAAESMQHIPTTAVIPRLAA